MILEKGQVKTLKEISSYNIRIARQTIGVANKIITQIYQKNWLNTLIIGPPQIGDKSWCIYSLQLCDKRCNCLCFVPQASHLKETIQTYIDRFFPEAKIEYFT